MAKLTDDAMLEEIKAGMGLTTNYQDATLRVFIREVQEFMSSAGVSDEMLSDTKAVGCILFGVNDLWNYLPGGTKFSEYTKQRAIQLSLEYPRSSKDGE